MNLVVLLGAGFSVPAGLPVGNALFEADLVVPHSKKASRDIEETLSGWRAWRAHNPHGRAEEFVSAVYASDSIEQMALWPSLVRFIGYRLADPFATFYGYEGRTTRSRDNIFEAQLCGAHEAWWDAILGPTSDQYALTVITLNWDICVERALRPRPTPRLHRPGFHYGWGNERLEATTAYPRSRWRKDPYISGSVPVLKLHGSLNWSLEYDRLVKYGDLHPAFRGDAAIVPPVTYKDTPPWAEDLWHEARLALANASRLLVVGYSFPDYDQRVRELVREGVNASLADVHVFDPDADNVCERLNRMFRSVRAAPHPGLPEGIADIGQIFWDTTNYRGSARKH